LASSTATWAPFKASWPKAAAGPLNGAMSPMRSGGAAVAAGCAAAVGAGTAVALALALDGPLAGGVGVPLVEMARTCPGCWLEAAGAAGGPPPQALQARAVSSARTGRRGPMIALAVPAA
jgi:hypothetical protein